MDLLYLNWPRRGDGEGGPPDADMATLARAVVAGGAAVFLGSGATSTGAGWTATGVGTWIAGVTTDWALRRLRMPREVTLTCTVDSATALTLFDQPGFSWCQRGQCVFLFGCDDLPRSIHVTVIMAALKSDPPGPLPDRCHGVLRPGTDGDFAELTRASLFAVHQRTDKTRLNP
jgi:hypothetical protein